MPVWRPVKRRELIVALRRLGFDGPFSGGKHEFMARGALVLTIPNPHGRDIGIALLKILLREAGITRKEQRLRAARSVVNAKPVRRIVTRGRLEVGYDRSHAPVPLPLEPIVAVVSGVRDLQRRLPGTPWVGEAA